jgi:hypothetical protein
LPTPNPRTVTGIILRPDASAWANALVRFRLAPGSFDPSVQFPSNEVVVATGTDGACAADLWANEEGTSASEYICTLPSGETFNFTLPLGDGSDIALSLLREAGSTPIDPQYPSLLSLVTTLVIEPGEAATDAANAAAASATSAAGSATSAATAATAATAAAGTATTGANTAAGAANSAASSANAAASSANSAAGSATTAAAAATAATNAITGGILVVDSETADSLTLHVISPATITPDSHTLSGYVIDTVIIGV